jgi:HD superfamily phosphohydrolase
MIERIYRDPVHNIISLRTDSHEGELLMRLIDEPEFQILRRINSETRIKPRTADGQARLRA